MVGTESMGMEEWRATNRGGRAGVRNRKRGTMVGNRTAGNGLIPTIRVGSNLGKMLFNITCRFNQ